MLRHECACQNSSAAAVGSLARNTRSLCMRHAGKLWLLHKHTPCSIIPVPSQLKHCHPLFRLQLQPENTPASKIVLQPIVQSTNQQTQAGRPPDSTPARPQGRLQGCWKSSQGHAEPQDKTHGNTPVKMQQMQLKKNQGTCAAGTTTQAPSNHSRTQPASWEKQALAILKVQIMHMHAGL